MPLNLTHWSFFIRRHFWVQHFRVAVESFSETCPFTTWTGSYLDKRLQQVLSWLYNRPKVNRYGNHRQKVEPWDCTVVTKDMHRISHSTVCFHLNKRQNVERSPGFLYTGYLLALLGNLVGHRSKSKHLPLSGLFPCLYTSWLPSSCYITVPFSYYYSYYFSFISIIIYFYHVQSVTNPHKILRMCCWISVVPVF